MHKTLHFYSKIPKKISGRGHCLGLPALCGQLSLWLLLLLLPYIKQNKSSLVRGRVCSRTTLCLETRRLITLYVDLVVCNWTHRLATGTRAVSDTWRDVPASHVTDRWMATAAADTTNIISAVVVVVGRRLGAANLEMSSFGLATQTVHRPTCIHWKSLYVTISIVALLFELWFHVAINIIALILLLLCFI